MNRMAFILTLSLFMWAGNSYAIDTGESAPDFHVLTVDGKEISYYKDVKGKTPAYLIFWSAW